MALASNINNIRYNGTGRAYVNTVGAAGPGVALGELENLTFNCSVSTEQLKSTLNAARATILEVETERNAEVSFGLREQSEENLLMALLGTAVNTLNQSAGSVDAATITWVADSYVDLGHLDVYSVKLSHGTVTNGPLAVGDTVTGGTSSATGKVAYVGSGFVEVAGGNRGTFVAGETITISTKSAVLSGVETQEDVIVTSADGATRRVQGTDYSIDPDYGYIRKLSTGAVGDTDELSYNYSAVNKKYLWGMSAGSVTKKFTFVTDPSDQGPRQRWTFHRVQINMSGDVNLIGEKQSVLSCKGSVLADTTQSSGQEYYKTEMM
jgi:hypothetical protein